ncbi:MAG TPA: glycosyltransferase family 39 protein, partial [Verrucomicrobiae bacterium]
GQLTPFTLYLPCLLATLGCVMVIYGMALRYFGWAAALWGGTLYLGNYLVARQICLARTDTLFSFTVALTAVLGFHAWRRGKGWTWFWLTAALASLTKGPLGLVLGAGGLLAALWESRTKPAPIKGTHLPGIALFVALTFGWLAAACTWGGEDVFDKLIRKELMNPTYDEPWARPPLYARVWIPALYLLGRFLPASLFTTLGCWRVIRHPARPASGYESAESGTHKPANALAPNTSCVVRADDERRFERFLFCWLALGLVIFAFPKHQRADLLMPLLPPAAILAGRELARLTRRFSRRRILTAATAVCAVLFTIYGWYSYHVARAENELVKQTVVLRDLAKRMQREHPVHPPLVHMDTPFTLQFYLNTKDPLVSPDEAARRLSATTAVWVAVWDYPKLLAAFGPGRPHLYEVAQGPQSGEALVRVMSNQIPSEQK